ncbi:VOC family protein [Marinicauda algicola]|uniref:VOC family protein n=1 Tax=Marinicauda algicola TaxID=2029849 RepID=A0A4S2GWF1_9PROT|nr:VOC family protein [Marinicauda algicola]TGY87440.1 VOC family protein [Marinicauda algicola]
MKLFRIILPVEDIEKAARLYGELFGQDGSRVSPGRHYFDAGGVTLALYDAIADGDTAPADVASEPVYFAVADLEAMRERCAKAGLDFPKMDLPGVGVLGRIETRPWGERCFYAMDPFGNTLCFVDEATALTA